MPGNGVVARIAGFAKRGWFQRPHLGGDDPEAQAAVTEHLLVYRDCIARGVQDRASPARGMLGGVALRELPQSTEQTLGPSPREEHVAVALSVTCYP